MLWVKICSISLSFTVLSPKHQAKKTEQEGRTECTHLECQRRGKRIREKVSQVRETLLLFIFPQTAGFGNQLACQQDAANYSSLSSSILQLKQHEKTRQLPMKSVIKIYGIRVSLCKDHPASLCIYHQLTKVCRRGAYKPHSSAGVQDSSSLYLPPTCTVSNQSITTLFSGVAKALTQWWLITKVQNYCYMKPHSSTLLLENQFPFLLSCWEHVVLRVRRVSLPHPTCICLSLATAYTAFLSKLFSGSQGTVEGKSKALERPEDAAAWAAAAPSWVKRWQ